jgi:hypothetical protein
MTRKIVFVFLSLAFVALLCSCEGDVGPAGPAGPDGPEGPAGLPGTDGAFLVMSPTTTLVAVGSTVTISVSTTGLASETYSWSSSNTDISTVSTAGVVTGVSEGMVFIGATGNTSGAAAFTSVTVVTEAATEVSFSNHILPLFTTDEIWFAGTERCTSCHAGEGPYSHELDMGTHAGVIAGADGGDEPILGNDVGQTNYDWGSSGLRRRLRNNRMPPNFPFVMDMSNRNGPTLEDDGTGHFTPKRPFEYGSEPDAVHLIGAWVDAISSDPADSTIVFSYGGLASLTFADDILPFFTDHNIWFEGSESCVSCHFDNSESSSHELDLTSYKGIMLGADAGDEAILVQGDWSASPLRKRFRNNRMPPGMPFQFGQANRKGPWLTHPVDGTRIQAVDLIGEWVSNGALDN